VPAPLRVLRPNQTRTTTPRAPQPPGDCACRFSIVRPLCGACPTRPFRPLSAARPTLALHYFVLDGRPVRQRGSRALPATLERKLDDSRKTPSASASWYGRSPRERLTSSDLPRPSREDCADRAWRCDGRGHSPLHVDAGRGEAELFAVTRRCRDFRTNSRTRMEFLELTSCVRVSRVMREEPRCPTGLRRGRIMQGRLGRLQIKGRPGGSGKSAHSGRTILITCAVSWRLGSCRGRRVWFGADAQGAGTSAAASAAARDGRARR